MKAAIIQSSYIPWRGYFDIINEVDIFVFLEDVKYTKRDWRNRNKVKTPNGTKWFSVPVIKGHNQNIFEARIDNSQKWKAEHQKTIHHSYSSSKFYNDYKDIILGIYDKEYETISDLNISIVKLISTLLGIKTNFVNSKDLGTTGVKDDKLIAICKKIGATCYLSGPSAKDYIRQEKFVDAGIDLEFKNYSNYPKYNQSWGEFDPSVSVIDLIFNMGKDAPHYIWGWRD